MDFLDADRYFYLFIAPMQKKPVLYQTGW